MQQSNSLSICEPPGTVPLGALGTTRASAFSVRDFHLNQSPPVRAQPLGRGVVLWPVSGVSAAFASASRLIRPSRKGGAMGPRFARQGIRLK
jgi:hypothetical protein